MQTIYLDFETYFDTKYSLKKMSTSLYIFDDRFKVHGFSIAIDDNAPVYYSMRDKEHIDKAKAAIDSIDWPNVLLVGHHLQFDALILTRHFGVKHVGSYACTLSMSRPLLTGLVKGHGLDELAAYYSIGHKLEGLEDTKGDRFLTPEQDATLSLYCNEDVRLCRELFKRMCTSISDFEMTIIDWHIRAYAEAEFNVDRTRAQAEVNKILDEKQELFAKVRFFLPDTFGQEDVESVLRSGTKLQLALEHNNIAVPMKKSPTTGLDTVAFAKTDQAFKDLPKQGEVAELFYEARLKSKADTALNKAKLLLEFAEHEPMPIYMNYARAVTLRSSGGDKIQAQNFPRGGEARKCLVAPPGHKVVSIDSSGIELRVALWFSQQEDKLNLVRQGVDLYKDLASSIYNKRFEDITKDERGTGKVAILGGQYGAGHPTFHNILTQGAMGPPMDLTLDETLHILTTFRTEYDMVAEMWKVCNNFLHVMCKDSKYEPVEYKGIRFEPERAYTHEGMFIHLPGLRRTSDGSFKYFGAQKQERFVYGSQLFNFCCQHTARNVVYKQINNVAKRYKPLMAVHDEVSIIVPDKEVEKVEVELLEIFRTPPDWCKDLPLNAETDIGQYYSK